MIEVSDSGRGVPLDAAESIFERSSRAAEGDRPGLGIGLAIVDAIATAHGGSLHARALLSAGRASRSGFRGSRPGGPGRGTRRGVGARLASPSTPRRWATALADAFDLERERQRPVS